MGCQPVIADGQFNLPQGFVWVDMHTLSLPRVQHTEEDQLQRFAVHVHGAVLVRP